MSRITPEIAHQGLCALLAHRRLSNIADAALAWLHAQGAQYLHEVITVIDDLADHVKLKVLEKKWLLNLLEEAVSAEPGAAIEAWTQAPTQADEETAYGTEQADEDTAADGARNPIEIL